jgi:hypothetical protein
LPPPPESAMIALQRATVKRPKTKEDFDHGMGTG